MLLIGKFGIPKHQDAILFNVRQIAWLVCGYAVYQTELTLASPALISSTTSGVT